MHKQIMKSSAIRRITELTNVKRAKEKKAYKTVEFVLPKQINLWKRSKTHTNIYLHFPPTSV